jgi:putative colanic acid biosynthesis acetyltransferase WcaF
MAAYQLRKIVKIDLGLFVSPEIFNNRNVLWRASWYVVNALFFSNSLLGLMPSSVKARLLRMFGATVGYGFVCKPRTSFKYPWFLEIGNNVWIGERAWIDNPCQVKIRSNVCISQGVYICTGNHDWNDRNFKFFGQPIEIGEGAWVTAFQVLGPGSIIPAHHVVLSSGTSHGTT